MTVYAGQRRPDAPISLRWPSAKLKTGMLYCLQSLHVSSIIRLISYRAVFAIWNHIPPRHYLVELRCGLCRDDRQYFLDVFVVLSESTSRLTGIEFPTDHCWGFPY